MEGERDCIHYTYGVPYMRSCISCYPPASSNMAGGEMPEPAVLRCVAGENIEVLLADFPASHGS